MATKTDDYPFTVSIDENECEFLQTILLDVIAQLESGHCFQTSLTKTQQYEIAETFYAKIS